MKSVKIALFALLTFLLAGGILSSCRYNPVINHPCDTCTKPCDTCNLNQDSLAHIRDSLAHAFSWKELTIPGEGHLTGVWVFGPNDIYIVGNSLWHFDGINFTDLSPIRNGSNTPMDGALNGFNIFALSKTDYWLVYVSAAFHTSDGKHFDDFRFGPVNACWGLSNNDMFFVGNSGHIYHYNGVKFDTMASNTTKDLRSVWGTSHNNVWATGWNSSKGETVLIHYDGASWTEDEFSTSGKINNYSIGTVWTCDSAGHPITVIAGTRVFHKTDNGPWRSDTSEVGNSLGGDNYIGIGAFGATSSDVFAIGGWGFVSHWNGKTWKKYDLLFDYSNNNYGPGGFSMKDNTACVVGVKSGQSWVAVGTRKR